jgi:hypothetical protein
MLFASAVAAVVVLVLQVRQAQPQVVAAVHLQLGVAQCYLLYMCLKNYQFL